MYVQSTVASNFIIPVEGIFGALKAKNYPVTEVPAFPQMRASNKKLHSICKEQSFKSEIISQPRIGSDKKNLLASSRMHT